MLDVVDDFFGDGLNVLRDIILRFALVPVAVFALVVDKGGCFAVGITEGEQRSPAGPFLSLLLYIPLLSISEVQKTSSPSDTL